MSTNTRIITNTRIKNNKELIYSKLSYQVIGASFQVFNELGWGYKEVYYQRALASEFDKANIKYKKEVDFPVKYNGKIIARYRIDFVIDNKIAIELKIRSKLGYVHMK